MALIQLLSTDEPLAGEKSRSDQQVYNKAEPTSTYFYYINRNRSHSGQHQLSTTRCPDTANIPFFVWLKNKNSLTKIRSKTFRQKICQSGWVTKAAWTNVGLTVVQNMKRKWNLQCMQRRWRTSKCNNRLSHIRPKLQHMQPNWCWLLNYHSHESAKWSYSNYTI